MKLKRKLKLAGLGAIHIFSYGYAFILHAKGGIRYWGIVLLPLYAIVLFCIGCLLHKVLLKSVSILFIVTLSMFMFCIWVTGYAVSIDNSISQTYINAKIFVLAIYFNNSGELSATSAARTDTAAALRTDINTVYVVCGGAKNQYGSTEAELMKEELRKAGIKDERVIEDAEPLDTYQSFKSSLKYISVNDNLVIVSSSSHLFRCYFLAKMFGYHRIRLVAAKEKFDTDSLYRYFRECGSFIHDLYWIVRDKYSI